MNKADAFLTQARSDLRVFELLLKNDAIEACHAMHYLQMATEKLAKAVMIAQNGDCGRTHVAFSKLPLVLSSAAIAEKLGFKGKLEAYRALLRRAKSLSNEIERLSPAIAYARAANDSEPNAEYPWELQNGDWQAPCHYQFSSYSDFRYKPDAKQLLHFLKTLMNRFGEIF